MVFLLTFLHLLTSPFSAPTAGKLSGASETASCSVQPADTLRSPRELYAKETLLSQYLFNGPRYHIYDRNEETHQFFKTRDILGGTLRYEGRDYGPFQMHYDLNFGYLVVKQPSNGFLVRLDSAKVEHFTIDGAYFERIVNHPRLKRGNYQHLHDGTVKLLCLRKKHRLEKIQDMKVMAIFQNADEYYIDPGNGYQRVQRKKDLYQIFPEYKSDIRTRFRRRFEPFKENLEANLYEVVKLVDQLKSTR